MNQPFSQKATSLKMDLERILSLKEKALEDALAPLRFEEALELVLSAPWEKRAELILASPYPEGLVRNLPPVELFLPLKEAPLILQLSFYPMPRGLRFSSSLILMSGLKIGFVLKGLPAGLFFSLRQGKVESLNG